jgi:hypothetical protein
LVKLKESIAMSTQNAERHGRHARDASTIEELGNSVERAIDELTREIKSLTSRVARLEAKQC